MSRLTTFSLARIHKLPRACDHINGYICSRVGSALPEGCLSQLHKDREWIFVIWIKKCKVLMFCSIKVAQKHIGRIFLNFLKKNVL